MAMRFHSVVAYDSENRFLKVLYAGEDGEQAVRMYHKERDAANFPRLAYFRNPPHSKRCNTVKQEPAPVVAPSGDSGGTLEGEEDDDDGDLAAHVAQAGKGKGKGKQ